MCAITLKYFVERRDSAVHIIYLYKVTYVFYSFRLYLCKVYNNIIKNIAATDDTAINIPENILR